MNKIVCFAGGYNEVFAKLFLIVGQVLKIFFFNGSVKLFLVILIKLQTSVFLRGVPLAKNKKFIDGY